MRFAFPGLLGALAERVTVVTPTPVLASVAIEQFNREQLALGCASWERPPVHGLDTWMINCWQDARFRLPNAPSLLSPFQERELWRQIIAAARPDLFDPQAMALLAQRAARVLAEYQIPIEGEAWAEHADAQEFRRWHQLMQRRLKAENWMTRSDLWRVLPNLITPEPVAFAGLTGVSPGLKSLSRTLGDSVQAIGIVYIGEPALASAVSFESAAEEIEHVARRVRMLLESNQSLSIGILVCDLPSYASDLSRILHEVLYPAAVLGDHAHMPAGRWIDRPLIASALLLLELAQPRVNHASAGAILRSPFIDGYREERSARALADQRLHRARELDFSKSEIEDAAWKCNILYQALRRISKVTDKLTASMSFSAWSARFSQILDAAKWPALENRNEREQRDLDEWNSALSELASLGLVAPPTTLNQAMDRLRSILNRPCAVGSWSSPVQVMDANAQQGIQFDHCFVLNASEEAWPSRVSLSPLIPYGLQQLYQVPMSNPESVAEERQRQMDALFRSAPRVEVSYTGNLAPSLRPHVSFGSADGALVWTGKTANQSYSSVALESQDDSQAPVFLPSETARGGAGLIKSQSQCPFKAFAEYRLNARGDDEACIGFDALKRGECAHKALELIWTELGTQQVLKSLPEGDLRTLVRKHLALAVREEEARGPIGALASLAERDRLESVVLQWLHIDRQRAMPFTVEKLEEKREVELSGLKLNLRMDRVDRLANGKLVLIDYKSGSQSQKKLEGERPLEPQLLVYAAAVGESVDGLYFGELKDRQARPVGHGAQAHFPKQRGTKAHTNDWDQFLEDSRSTIHRLAEEFQRGDAAVTPLRGACAYCSVKPVCRVGAAACAEEEE